MPVHPHPQILLLSAYRADSHAAWADWLCNANPGFHWQRLELPGRYFRWRIRGNPLSWLDDLKGVTPDALVATSMVDLATLRGLHPQLAHAPALYYFHENQFAYPISEYQMRSIEPQMVQLYGALAADQTVFNSSFNRDSFLEGVRQLLARMPDAVPDAIVERLAATASVLPVPITPIAPAPGDRDARLILWNHRWEYDKAPETFASAMLELAELGLDFRLALLGPRPRSAPACLLALRRQLGERIITDGFVSRAEYRAILGRAGIAVSTAMHEFQGLAMLEAVSAGAVPLVPDTLAYTEQYPLEYRYRADESGALVNHLARWLKSRPPPAPDVHPWTEAALLPAWQATLKSLLAA